MREAEDSFIRRAAGAIIAIVSLVIISLMLSGGCDGTATSNQIPTPTPTWAPSTGFPPHCDGTFDVSLSCPATSLAGSVCQPYWCDIIDDSIEPGAIVDEITVVFGNTCTDVDCFTLECQGIHSRITETSIGPATIIIETVNDIPVGEDVEGEEFSGLPDGRIIIDGQDLLLDCNSIIVP
ncbi:MAG: hypothetical protein KJ002_05575 [Candidatus Dadabacteria bacterium]|nr:hypothetical protein [Candidatus Dadabacteria bacterium]